MLTRCCLSVLLLLATLGCDDIAPNQAPQLNLKQTLLLSKCNPFRGTGGKYHLFKRADPDANAQLLDQCRALANSEEYVNSSPLILGYTGGSAEANAMIEILGQMSDRHAQDPESVMTGREIRFLTAAFIGLGLMGRRDIPEARDFLAKSICGDTQLLYGLLGRDPPSETTLLDLALTGYAIMQPDDLESQLKRAKERIKRKYPDYDWYQTTSEGLQSWVTMIDRSERQSVSEPEQVSILQQADQGDQ